MAQAGGPICGESARTEREKFYVGRKIIRLEEVASTQDEVKRRAAAGEPEGLVVVAGSQTLGRGRKGGRWHSPSGTGLYLSILLCPDFDAVSLLPLAIGLAAAEAVDKVTPHRTSLKWPNDLLLGGLKLGGILVESQVQDGRIQHVVAGIGINLNEPAGGWPADVTAIATSLSGCVGQETLLAAVLEAVARTYGELRDGRSEEILRRYRARCLLRGGALVRAEGIEGALRAIEIESDGSLLVEGSDGVQRRLYGQPVTLAAVE